MAFHLCSYCALFQAIPIFHVRVFDFDVMMTIVSWHHGIAAGGCSYECEEETSALKMHNILLEKKA